MKLNSLFLLTLAAESAVASSWFGTKAGKSRRVTLQCHSYEHHRTWMDLELSFGSFLTGVFASTSYEFCLLHLPLPCLLIDSLPYSLQ